MRNTLLIKIIIIIFFSLTTSCLNININQTINKQDNISQVNQIFCIKINFYSEIFAIKEDIVKAYKANNNKKINNFQREQKNKEDEDDENDESDEGDDGQNNNDSLGQDDNIEEIQDPFIKFNRKMYSFNSVLDTYFLRQYARLYEKITPLELRNLIANGIDNYKTPISVVNSALQKNGKNTALHFWRFVINSTLGCFGLFDIATKMGLEKPPHKNFGSTLAYLGAKPGPYIMLPIFGPTNLRDMWDLVFLNTNTNYINYTAPNYARYLVAGLSILEARSALLKFDSTINNYPDAYIFIKVFSHENRQKNLQK